MVEKMEAEKRGKLCFTPHFTARYKWKWINEI